MKVVRSVDKKYVIIKNMEDNVVYVLPTLKSYFDEMCTNCSKRTNCSNSSCKFHHEQEGECYICTLQKKEGIVYNSLESLFEYLKENDKLLYKSWKHLLSDYDTYINDVMKELML